MIFAVAAIVAAWIALLGTAYVGAQVLKAGPLACGSAVLFVYLCLGGASLLILGTGWQGWAGAVGMLLPCAVALALVRIG